MAVCATISTLAFLFFYKEKPSVSVSPSSSLPRLRLSTAFKHIASSPSIVLLILHCSINFATGVCFAFTMGTGYFAYGVSPTDIHDFTFLAIPFIIVFTLLFAFLSGRIGFKAPLMLISAISCLLLLLLNCLLELHSILLFGALFISFQINVSFISSLGLEFAS